MRNPASRLFTGTVPQTGFSDFGIHLLARRGWARGSHLPGVSLPAITGPRRIKERDALWLPLWTQSATDHGRSFSCPFHLDY